MVRVNRRPNVGRKRFFICDFLQPQHVKWSQRKKYVRLIEGNIGSVDTHTTAKYASSENPWVSHFSNPVCFIPVDVEEFADP